MMVLYWYISLQNNSKKTVFYVNSSNFPEFFKIFQKAIIIMQSGPFYINYLKYFFLFYFFYIFALF